MKEYRGINYEKNENCFQKTKHVKSILLYGDVTFFPRPLFTLLIPTYKRVEFLQEALESAIKQWHVPFEWEILVLDNEKYDGKSNETEMLIRKLHNPRIIYYRNSENIRPGDNFNRGIYLARGKWVMMLHDDDILFHNSLRNMYNLLTALDHVNKRQVGAISAKYHQFKYDEEKPDSHKEEIENTHNWYAFQPMNYGLYKLSHSNVIFTGHIGGDIPSNGTTFLREAVLKVGGFNDDFGICADLVLFYALENYYDVYSTAVPYGFYRWGKNTMAKKESAYETIKFNFDFREYVYNKGFFHKIWGFLFRKCQHRRFSINVLGYRKIGVGDKINISEYESICSLDVNRSFYVFYALIVRYVFEKYKGWEMTRLYRKIVKEISSNDERYI